MSTVEGWHSSTVEDCCDILDSMRIPVNAEERQMRIGAVPYYGANGLQGYIDDFIFNEPLILIAEDGGRFEEFATRPIAYHIKGKSWVNNHAHVLRAKSAFSQDLVFYALEHKDIQSFIVGGTRAKLNQRALRTITIELPTSKLEQTKIAEVLSTVDQAIEQTEALIAKQQRIKTGLMQDLLTRGIDEQGNLRSEETHAFKDSPLGRISVDWKPSNLGKLAVFLSGYAFKNQELSEHGWRVVRISNLHKPDFPYWHYDGKVKPSWVIQDGDILFSWAGVASSIDCIRYSGRDALMNQHIYNFKFASEKLKTYVYYFLQSYLPILRTEIEGGAGQLHLTKAKIQSIAVPQLNDAELERTVAILEKLEETLANYHKQFSKLRSLKTGMMQDLLTGKVRITPLLEAEVNQQASAAS